MNASSEAFLNSLKFVALPALRLQLIRHCRKRTLFSYSDFAFAHIYDAIGRSDLGY